jgi:hypothetical protein
MRNRKHLVSVTKSIYSHIPASRHLPELLLSKARVSDGSLIAAQFTGWDVLRKPAFDRLGTIGKYMVTPSLHDLVRTEATAELGDGRRH